MKLQYDKLNKVTWVVGEGYKTKAYQAASGFQSIAPLVVVSDYLAGMVKEKAEEPMSAEDKERLRKEIQKIQSNSKFTDEIKNLLMERLNSLLKIDCFWNIVEEPEQNLHPQSQRTILNVLTQNFNQSPHNGLIITTHSPYMINYISLNIKAGAVAEKCPNRAEAISSVVPKESWLKAEQVKVFEIQPDGSVIELETYEGMPSDNNYLNNALAETNILFDQLLEIEDGNY